MLLMRVAATPGNAANAIRITFPFDLSPTPQLFRKLDCRFEGLHLDRSAFSAMAAHSLISAKS
jgi:hypothetical protein